MNRNVVIIVAIVLIALGAFGLARGKFDYTDKHATQVGNIELSVKEKDSVAVPQWLSIGAIAAGALLLVFGRRK
jgi:hypothetical protein